jgi:hypothetical protein
MRLDAGSRSAMPRRGIGGRRDASAASRPRGAHAGRAPVILSSVKPFLVVNPRSAAGRTGRHFDAIARAVRAEVGEFDCAFTICAGDGSRLAREAVAAGARLVIAVGGDGTASEVIHGLVNGASEPQDVVFGYIHAAPEAICARRSASGAT